MCFHLLEASSLKAAIPDSSGTVAPTSFAIIAVANVPHTLWPRTPNPGPLIRGKSFESTHLAQAAHLRHGAPERGAKLANQAINQLATCRHRLQSLTPTALNMTATPANQKLPRAPVVRGEWGSV